MRVLKNKFRKKVKISGGDKLEYKPQVVLVLSKLPKIKQKQGKWCDYYEGRLPYPVECQTNKHMPISYLFDGGERTLMYDRSKCIRCKRSVDWRSWKMGEWDKIKEAIANLEDLRDMNPPFKDIE